MGVYEHSHEYVICPRCHKTYGDADEWCNDETPQIMQCENEECGARFACWAEYDVTYISKLVADA